MTYPPVVVVDKHDHEVGVAMLLDVWRQGLWYRTVQVIVEDGKGNILLQKRAPTMTLFPNRWEVSASGHVDEGATYESAAKTELFEELGISSTQLQEIGYYSIQKIYPERIMNHYSKVYRIQAHMRPGFTPPAHEVSALKWTSITDIKDFVHNHPDQVTDVLKEIISRYY